MKNSENKVFRLLDEELFKAIKKFKDTKEFEQISDFFSTLSEDAQRALSLAVSYFLLVLPIILVAIFYLYLSGLKTDKDQKVEIYNTAQQVLAKSKLSDQAIKKFTSPQVIASRSALLSRISEVLGLAQIDLTKVQIQSFNKEELFGKITKVNSRVSFNGLTHDELMDFFTGLDQRLKMNIESISIRKDSNDLLKGYFNLQHLSEIPGA